MAEYLEGSIRCFDPDNDENTLYVNCGSYGGSSFDLEHILDLARDHFGNPELALNEISIGAEHIHTRCLGHDQHDPTDHTNFLVITRNPQG